MKPVLVVLLMFIMLAGTAMTAQTPGKETETQINPHLKKVNFVRIRCLINGTTVYKAYPSPRATDIEEFNFDEAAAQFEGTNIPVKKKDILALYDQFSSQLKDSGVRVLDVKRPTLDAHGRATIIPVASLHIELQEVTAESNVMLIYVTVSRWVSTWSGSERIYGPVVVWWKKHMTVVDNEEFIPRLKEKTKTMVGEFLTELAAANPPAPEEEQEGDLKKNLPSNVK